MRKSRGMTIASAAASLILAGTITVRADSHAEKAGGETVHCAGVNECKGKSACATDDNACAGQNACKGKGFIDMSASDCTEKGGKVIEGKH